MEEGTGVLDKVPVAMMANGDADDELFDKLIDNREFRHGAPAYHPPFLTL
jgi:hypothetical protein